MIFDSLATPDPHATLSPRLEAGLAWLRALDPATPDGRYPIEGDDVFALVQTYETGPSTEKRFESHRKFLDIQYVFEGEERMLHAPARLLEVETPYDDPTDILFYAEPKYASSLLVRTGDFTVFHPGDAHKPGCMAGARHRVRKVVVKVRIE